MRKKNLNCSDFTNPTRSLVELNNFYGAVHYFYFRAGRKIDWCQPVGFKAAPGPVVALASFPGSGNTWVRYLLQQVIKIFF